MSTAEAVPVRENALFRELAADRLARLIPALEPVSFAPDEIIFDEGERGDCCYLIESGTVRISKASRAGSQETLGFIGAGEFFGEMALYYSTPRAARATASTPTQAVSLRRPDFEQLREQAPLELTTAVAEAGNRHLRGIHTQLVRHLADTERLQEIGLGLSMIAHDIRSPLATIVNAAELLAELAAASSDAAAVVRYAEMIRRTANNALAGVEELLAAVRGDVEPNEAPVPVDDLVSEAADSVAGVVSGRPVEFRVTVAYQGTIVCVRTELARALVNLLRNAVEALPPEGGMVRLHVAQEDASVVFDVSDTGCGIPPEQQARLFERRFTHGKSGGTGLGLDQVRRTVERHAGRIEVHSIPGEGSTFRVSVPIRAHVSAGV